MALVINSKVRIKHKTREFYRSAIQLTIFRGTLISLSRKYANVKFDDGTNRTRTVFSNDLEYTKGRQLLFDFMEC